MRGARCGHQKATKLRGGVSRRARVDRIVDGKATAMGWFRNLNTGKQLAVAFGFLEVLMIGLGVFGLQQLATVNGTAVQVVSVRIPSVRVLGALKYDASAVRRFELSRLLAYQNKEKWDAPMKQALLDVLAAIRAPYCPGRHERSAGCLPGVRCAVSTGAQLLGDVRRDFVKPAHRRIVIVSVHADGHEDQPVNARRLARL